VIDPAARQFLSPQSAWGAAILIAASFFVAVAPTLPWLEFASTTENLVVAASLECRRGGQWIIPTLEGEPRLANPPLTTWIAAASIRPSTLRAIASEDFRTRAAGYRALAWDVRWPALLTSCLMLLAIFDLGKTIAGAPAGLLAMTACGSSIFFLRFARQMTTDVQLALWVTLACAAMARWVLQGPSWRAAIVAGIALGLALMSKGPVALIQTLVPVGAFVVWRGRKRTKFSPGQIIVACIITLAIGLTWYLFLLAHDPGAWDRWRREFLRSDMQTRSGSSLTYLSLFIWMLPWTAVLIHGLLWTMIEAWRARRYQSLLPAESTGMILAMFLLVVPVLLMSLSHDRQARYLLPMIGAASVLSARGILAMLNPESRTRIRPWVQWLILFIIAVGLPIAGATVLKRVDGKPWYPVSFAAIVIGLMMLVMLIAHQMSLRRPVALVVGTAVIMLLLGPVFYIGYRQSEQGRADLRSLADIIRTAAPNTRLYDWRPDGPQCADTALSIYMDRPTIWIRDPSNLKSSAGANAEVIVVEQHAGRAALLPPARWFLLAKMPRNGNVFCAFIRPADTGNK
jgi:4-amino-4-deoxy-L-arabinose transferase-like glycosyltransferase